MKRVYTIIAAVHEYEASVHIAAYENHLNLYKVDHTATRPSLQLTQAHPTMPASA